MLLVVLNIMGMQVVNQTAMTSSDPVSVVGTPVAETKTGYTV